jgi:hypothetical protein
MTPAESHAFAEGIALFAILFVLALYRVWNMYAKHSPAPLANESAANTDLEMIEARSLS